MVAARSHAAWKNTDIRSTSSACVTLVHLHVLRSIAYELTATAELSGCGLHVAGRSETSEGESRARNSLASATTACAVVARVNRSLQDGVSFAASVIAIPNRFLTHSVR